MTPVEVAEEFLAKTKAKVVGHHAHTAQDGTVYHFYRGKIADKDGEKSAPRVLVVVEPNGNVRPAQPLGSYDRKKLRHFLRKHS
jgi:MoaA/NifB/PqqE/SkfB family radical SAM enzyme